MALLFKTFEHFLILASLESPIQALQNYGSLILAFGGVFSLESVEVPPINENLYFRGNIDMGMKRTEMTD